MYKVIPMTHSTSSLTRTFTLSMGTLIIWVVFSYISMLQLLSLQKENKELIDLTSNQRVLTQQIALYSSQYVLRSEPEDINKIRKLIIDMEHDYALITARLSHSEIKSISQNAITLKATNKIFLDLLYDFSVDPSKQQLFKITETSQRLVKQLKHTIKSLEDKEDEILSNIKERQFLILIGTLLTLLFETLFLVRPIINFLNRHTQYLEEEIKKRTKKVMLYATIFEKSNEGMIITEEDTTIIDVNRAFSDITGYSKDDAIGNSPNMLKSGEHDQQFFDEMWRSIHENNQWQGEIINKNKSGQLFNAHLSIVKLYDKRSDSFHYLSVFSDITELIRNRDRMRHMATHDALTSLPNRTFFLERTEHALEMARRNDKAIAVIFIDLDNFKIINDSMGHHVGDRYLIEIAKRLHDSVRTSDTVARLGGDEFIILLEALTQKDDYQIVIEKIHSNLNAILTLEGHDFHPEASMGVIYMDKESEETDVNTLIRKADMAMYSAKESGKNAIELYSERLDEQIQDHLNVETKLRKAIEYGELELFYQPKVELKTQEMKGAEALLRWKVDEHYVRPDKFIGIAEESEIIVDIDLWVLQEALEVLKDWQEGRLSKIRLSINLSAKTFSKPEAMKKYIALLAASEVAESLDIEITESVLMGNLSEAITTLHLFNRYGVTTSLDDFGVGYSSFSYLSQMPFNTIKIDRSFVIGLNNLEEHDTKQQILIDAIISFSTKLGMNIVAEGIENEVQLAWLLEHGCAQGQGYFFSRPLPRGGFEHLYNPKKKNKNEA